MHGLHAPGAGGFPQDFFPRNLEVKKIPVINGIQAATSLTLEGDLFLSSETIFIDQSN